MTLASIIAAWAALWVLAAAVVTVAGLRRGRPLPTAAWLVTIGAFLAAQEDPLLLIQMASTRPRPTGFRDGVLGLVHAHTRGHMYGAAILALAGLGLVGAGRFLAAGNRPRPLRGVRDLPPRFSTGPDSIRWCPWLRLAHTGRVDRDLGRRPDDRRSGRAGQEAAAPADPGPQCVAMSPDSGSRARHATRPGKHQTITSAPS